MNFSRYILISNLFFLISCASHQKVALTTPSIESGNAVESGCKNQKLERIYFGAARPGGLVGNNEWRSFLKEVITSRFPSGLTVIEGKGQWLGKDGEIVEEPSRIVEIIHTNTSPERKALSEIASIYKVRYQQEAVLITESDVVACF